MRNRRVCMALMTAILLAAPAVTPPAEAKMGDTLVGGSLGVVMADRLTTRDDFLGARLVPAPSVGAHVRRAPEASGEMGWDAAAAFALFQSESDSRIRIIHVPVEAGLLLGVANVQEVALELRVAVGGVIVSGGLGERHETTAMGMTTLGGQVAHDIHNLSVVLGIEGGVLWQGSPRPVFQVRLALMTG